MDSQNTGSKYRPEEIEISVTLAIKPQELGVIKEMILPKRKQTLEQYLSEKATESILSDLEELYGADNLEYRLVLNTLHL